MNKFFNKIININSMFGFRERRGMTVVETIIAIAIFSVLSTVAYNIYIGADSLVKRADQKSTALWLAEEGIEATRSIRDEAFSNLTAGSKGLSIVGNKWIYSGTEDLTNSYLRSVSLSSIDASNIAATSTVSWNYRGSTSTVALSTVLTDWHKIVTLLTNGGIIFYGDTTLMPKYRLYDTSTNTFGAQTNTATTTAGKTFIVRTSPIKKEAIAGFVDSSGTLNVMCFDGISWSQEFSATVGGTGTTRRFDIAYETTSGDVMVLYSTNAATTNEMAYRTKLGSSSCSGGNWTAATNLNPIRTSGIVQWVKMAWDKRSGNDLITAVWADANSDLSSMVWSGIVWGNEPTISLATALDVVAAAQDVENFDVEYESLSGDVMVVWGITVGNGVNGVRYSTCTGGTASCTWSGILTPATFADDAVSLDISANPNTNQIVFASVGTNQNDLQIGYWSGTAWTNNANIDTSCNTPIAGSRLVSTGWLVSSGTSVSVIRYADQGSSAIDWYTGANGVFTKKNDFVPSPAPNGPIYYDTQMDPLNASQLISLVSDGANDLFAKRLVFMAPSTFTWTNSDSVALTTSLSQSINSPYSFAFWRF